MTIRRRVTCVTKNADGDILSIGNPNVWGRVSKKDAISQIESESYSYYVIERILEVDIKVVNDRVKGKYLRTDPDRTTKNNLDDLPECNC